MTAVTTPPSDGPHPQVRRGRPDLHETAALAAAMHLVLTERTVPAEGAAGAAERWRRTRREALRRSPHAG